MARRSSRRAKQPHQKGYRIFVSHATADKWLAKVICEKIEEVGARTFRDDRDIAGGDDIPDEIRKAINESDEMLVLLTPASVNRPWVLMEIGAAWQRGDGMRVVGIRQHVETEPIPAMLKTKKVIELNEFDTYTQELKKRLRRSR